MNILELAGELLENILILLDPKSYRQLCSTNVHLRSFLKDKRVINHYISNVDRIVDISEWLAYRTWLWLMFNKQADTCRIEDLRYKFKCNSNKVYKAQENTNYYWLYDETEDINPINQHDRQLLGCLNHIENLKTKLPTNTCIIHDVQRTPIELLSGLKDLANKNFVACHDHYSTVIYFELSYLLFLHSKYPVEYIVTYSAIPYHYLETNVDPTLLLFGLSIDKKYLVKPQNIESFGDYRQRINNYNQHGPQLLLLTHWYACYQNSQLKYQSPCITIDLLDWFYDPHITKIILDPGTSFNDKCQRIIELI